MPTTPVKAIERYKKHLQYGNVVFEDFSKKDLEIEMVDIHD